VIKRISIVKPTSVGFTTLLTGAIGNCVANDPAPILALLPTKSDARDYVVSDIEPTFAASGLGGMLTDDTERERRFAV
jgi:phage terminase large subunit GpA-like protein